MKIVQVYADALQKGGYPKDIRWLSGTMANTHNHVVLVAKPGQSRDGLGDAEQADLEHLQAVAKDADLVHIWGVFIPGQLRASRPLKGCGPTVLSPLAHLLSPHLRRKWWKKTPYLIATKQLFHTWPHVAHLFSDEETVGAKRYLGSDRFFQASLGVYPQEDSACVEQRERDEFLLFFGRNDVYQKGIDRLLDAYGQACVNGLRLPLVIAGQPHESSDAFIAGKLRSLNLESNVTYIGAVSDERKKDLLRSARALIFPSRWDGPPRPIREAIACETPVIVTPGTNMGDIVETYGAGRCADSTLALANAICEAESSSTAAQWRDGARRLRTALGWHQVAQQYLRGYEFALGATW